MNASTAVFTSVIVRVPEVVCILHVWYTLTCDLRDLRTKVKNIYLLL